MKTKISLVLFTLIFVSNVCLASNVETYIEAEKTINTREITPTNFAKRLKKTNSYNSPSYKINSYSNYAQNPMLNATMNGMMNSIMMGQGVMDTSFSAATMQKQQEEYVKQQIEYSKQNGDDVEVIQQQPMEDNSDNWF